MKSITYTIEIRWIILGFEHYGFGSDKHLYNLSMNVCAGENMLVQSFDDGFMESKKRNQNSAVLRPVRRIPIIKSECYGYSIIDAYNNFISTSDPYATCLSCPDGCS